VWEVLNDGIDIYPLIMFWNWFTSPLLREFIWSGKRLRRELVNSIIQSIRAWVYTYICHERYKDTNTCNLQYKYLSPRAYDYALVIFISFANPKATPTGRLQIAKHRVARRLYTDRRIKCVPLSSISLARLNRRHIILVYDNNMARKYLKQNNADVLTALPAALERPGAGDFAPHNVSFA
jgi:hypothetical protein